MAAGASSGRADVRSTSRALPSAANSTFLGFHVAVRETVTLEIDERGDDGAKRRQPLVRRRSEQRDEVAVR